MIDEPCAAAMEGFFLGGRREGGRERMLAVDHPSTAAFFPSGLHNCKPYACYMFTFACCHAGRVVVVVVVVVVVGVGALWVCVGERIPVACNPAQPLLRIHLIATRIQLQNAP